MSRVLMIAPTPFFGDRGCHVRILEEVRALRTQGIDTEVVTYPVGRDVPGLRIHRAAAMPGVTVRAVGPSYGRIPLDGSLLLAAARVAKRFRPHCLHAHLHEGIAIGVPLRRRFGIPLVADLQGSLAGELADHGFLGQRGMLPALVRRVERWLVRQPDALLVSARSGQEMLAEQGVDTRRVYWLPDGVDLEQFRPRAADPSLLRRLGLEGRRVVVYLGVLTAYQGVDLLLDAVPDVVRAVPDAHFLIMGYPNEEAYREQVAARGLSAHVTLPGRIPYAEAAAYLTLGCVAVSPKQSQTEANGKLLNYMACGLPTVASDTRVNRDLLGDAGVYVPVGDAGALADGLAALLHDPARRSAAGAALRARVERTFAWPALASRLAGIYERLVPADAHAAES
ncbi:MAG TPA: glycosyltransferase [Vicinamibacterales bacterium]